MHSTSSASESSLMTGTEPTRINRDRVRKSTSLLGEDTTEMLFQVHRDALWILEYLGVGCKQPDIQGAFKAFEAEGLAVLYEDRIYVTSALVEKCL